MIYLDNNATTAIDEDVIRAMMDCFAQGPMNPSSQHGVGRRARQLLDDACAAMGTLLGADLESPDGDQLIFTSGGSESNNLALTGLGDPAAPLIVSAIEHPSVLAVASRMRSEGRDVRVIPVLPSGIIDLQAAEDLLSQSPLPTLVSVMAANNETGVIQPIDVLANRCRERNVLFHTDATQTIGKLPFHFVSSQATAATFTAHKFHGPPGIGGLLVRSGVAVRPLMLGGEQQLGKRPGTEAVPLVVGMAAALHVATASIQETSTKIATLRDQFERELSAGMDELEIHGKDARRLPGTSCCSLLGTDRQAMLMALDMNGIACSSGSACASGSSRPSHVLEAMGLREAAINSAIRVGMSKFSTMDDVLLAAATMCRQYRRLRKI